jgi:hypothetical protein
MAGKKAMVTIDADKGIVPSGAKDMTAVRAVIKPVIATVKTISPEVFLVLCIICLLQCADKQQPNPWYADLVVVDSDTSL